MEERHGMIPPRRALPLLPHPDHLRKQAKARLAAMREKSPTARLAEAQLVIAREYGFDNWGAMQAEVTRRTKGPRGATASLRRADLTPLHAARFQESPDADSALHAPMDFFRLGLVAQIGFVFVALAGLALVFVAIGPHDAASAPPVLAPLARLLHGIF